MIKNISLLTIYFLFFTIVLFTIGYMFKLPINPDYHFIFILIIQSIYTFWVFQNVDLLDNTRYSKFWLRFQVKLTIILYIFGFLIFLAGSSFFNAVYMSKFLDTYKESSVIEANLKEELHIDFDKVEERSVLLEMAEKKASRVLGEKIEGRNISSQYELGKGSLILKNKEQLWVFPIEYRSVLKWISLDYTPGYITVSASDPDAEAELHKIKMYKQVSGWFADSVELKSWVGSGFRGYSVHFEVDDDGHPFYIASLYKSKVFWGMDYVDQVLTIDAVTGELKYYEFGAQPDWIDQVVNESLSENYLDWNGSLHTGFWNKYLAQENVETTTGEGLWSIVMNGEQFYFTGMSSPSYKDNSLTSLRVFNPRTANQIIFDDFNGLMDEKAALEAIDSSLGADSQRWKPVVPQIRKIEGNYYYFASIVSKTNIFQKYGAVDAGNPSNIYLGKSLSELERKIKNKSEDESDDGLTAIISKKKYEKMMLLIEQLNALSDSLKNK